MAGFEVRRTNGRWSIRARGCCGNLAAWDREFERAFAEQVLRDQGRIDWPFDGTPSLIDKRGKRHRITPYTATALAGDRAHPDGSAATQDVA